MDIVPRGWATAPQRSSEMEVNRNHTHVAEKDGSDDEHGAPLTDDSSDEEEDDEEEALKIQEGFIVDDEDEEEGGEGLEEGDSDRKRKKRKHHRRQIGVREEDEEEDEEMGDLDEEDLELLEENTGTRIERRNKAPKRIRRGREDNDDNEQGDAIRKKRRVLDDDNRGVSQRGGDLGDLWDDDSIRRVRRAREEDEDEPPEFGDDMRDFIEDDDEDEDIQMGEAERQERLEQRRAEAARKRKAGGRPQVAGLDTNAWQEIFEVFGDGTDYDWALGDDEQIMEQVKTETNYTDVFEPSEIRARMLTEDDDLIRAQDIPERMQLVTSSLSTTATLSLDPPLVQDDLQEAAHWVSLRLSTRIQNEFFTPSGKMHQYLTQLVAAVRSTLEHLFLNNLEVPYIMTHKQDDIWHIDPPRRIELLNTSELWRVYTLGQKFRALVERKKALDSNYRRLNISDNYYEHEIKLRLESIENVTDTTEWLATKYQTEQQDAAAIEDGIYGVRKMKKPTRVSEYDVLKKTSISKLAAEYCLPASEIASNYYHLKKNNRPRYFIDDPDLPPTEHAAPYVQDELDRLGELDLKRRALGRMDGGSHINDISADKILKRAKLLVATEISMDPLMRKEVREIFKNSAEVSCYPTDKGLVKIDEHHPYYNFKYLQKKPVTEMTRSPQFLNILAAEADHLVTVTVTMREETRTNFINELTNSCKSDSFGQMTKQWNDLRAQTIQEAVDNFLVPFGAKYVREWLREEVEDHLAKGCADELERRVNAKPYFTSRSEATSEAPATMAVSWGHGDPKKDSIAVAFLDDEGRLREHAMFDNLQEQQMQKEFLNILKRRTPDLIVIGGFSVQTHRLYDQVRAIARDPDYLVSINEDDLMQERGEDEPPSVPVRYIFDEVARLFQHSKRAEDEFGTLPVLTRYCIGLARYAQSPLNEYAALGADMIAITFDEEGQHLIPKEKLLTALERATMNVVNVVGVDINRAVHDPYYQHLLPFVSGLGPRKAQLVINKIQSGHLTNREQFVSDGLMTTSVWLNAAAFLRIPQDPDSKPPKNKQGEKPNFAEMPDPLDGTRLHPQDYEFARKMAVDALEVDEEDYSDEHPSAVVTMFMKADERTREKQLKALSLDDFAQNLLTTQREKKRMTLDLIHEELLHPFIDKRPPFVGPDAWEIMTMLTSETPKSLARGLIVPVQVVRIKQAAALVRLSSNMEATLEAYHFVDEGEQPVPIERLVKPGQVVNAVISEVDPVTFKVQLHARPSVLQTSDKHLRNVVPDPYYDGTSAYRDNLALDRRRKQINNQARRVIKHPNFHNMRSKEAEEYLSKQQRGDVVIRPSSHGSNHLAVSWKVDKGIYQHIDVLEEPVDPSDPMAGYIYCIGQDRSYTDLDELIVNYVKAIARKVEELMADEKYKHETPDQLRQSLELFIKGSPDKSMYAFCLDPEHPGYFRLMFIASPKSPVVQWPVKVTPEAYVFFGQPLPSVPQLCNAFKMRHLAGGVHNKPLQPGSTPYGGRTPGRMTGLGAGMTASSAKTPNPYQQGTPMAPPSGYRGPVGSTPIQPFGATPLTTGPTLSGYGAMPPVPGTPAWGAPPPVPQRGPQMNPARAAMIQENGGWGNNSGSSGGGGWPRR